MKDTTIKAKELLLAIDLAKKRYNRETGRATNYSQYIEARQQYERDLPSVEETVETIVGLVEIIEEKRNDEK